MATRGSVFIKKCVAPIRALIVPKGCSTVLVHVADLAPGHTHFEAWFENIADGTIPGHLIATLWRQMLGYGLAVVIGITIGLAMGYYRLLYNLFEPLVEVLRPIPGPAYLPIWCSSRTATYSA